MFGVHSFGMTPAFFSDNSVYFSLSSLELPMSGKKLAMASKIFLLGSEAERGRFPGLSGFSESSFFLEADFDFDFSSTASGFFALKEKKLIPMVLHSSCNYYSTFNSIMYGMHL
jgi:hypothetical protein